jgi:S-adenosylmethionine decarboxylase proenzyme
MTRPALPGLHLIGDLHDCRCGSEYLVSRDVLRAHCLALVDGVSLTAKGDYFHQFDADGGVTGVVVLSESHVAIHTWPEKSTVTLDVYVCNYETDNREKAVLLFQALVSTFSPKEPRICTIDRV